MAKNIYPGREAALPEEQENEAFVEPAPTPTPKKKEKVDVKAWRERALMTINNMSDPGKAKRAAERILRNKEA